MSDLLLDPPRWKDRDDQSNTAERAAGAAIRSLAPCKPLSPVQLARIAAEIRPAPNARSPRRLWLALATGLLLCTATAASAARLTLLPHWLVAVFHRDLPPRTPTRSMQGVGASHAGTRVPRAPASKVPPVDNPAFAPGAEDAQQAPPIETPTRRPPARLAPARFAPGATSRPSAEPTPSGPEPFARATPPSARPIAMPELEPPSVPAPDALAPPLPWGARAATVPPIEVLPPASTRERIPVATTGEPPSENPGGHPQSSTRTLALREPREIAPRSAPPRENAAAYLSEAIRALRTEHAPTRALAELDRHQSALEQGALAHEALIVRVEALLVLRRDVEALRILDLTTLGNVAAQRPLLVTRGELRAAHGRCAEALEDFALVLAKSRSADPRAQQGQADCLRRLGRRAQGDQ
jgi:hypothetical protein